MRIRWLYCFLALLWPVSLLGLAALWACSEAVEVNAPYQERASVYALLNVQDTVHYIRVQKTFLTIREKDAAIAAQTKDSIYYTGPDVLNVRLYRIGERGDTVLLGRLERVDLTSKDSGYFHAPDHLSYRFRGRLVPEDSIQLRLRMRENPNALARRRILLTVENTRTGYRAWATTKLVYPIWDDLENGPFFGSYSLLDPARLEGKRTFRTFRPRIKFNRHINGVVFKIMVNIPYMEVMPDSTRDTLLAPWTYQFDRPASFSEVIIERAYLEDFEAFAFFETLKAQVDTARPVAYRRLLPLQIRVLAADSNLYYYNLTSRRFSPITQTAPMYTNIRGGIGLMAGRADKSFTVETSPETYTILNRRAYSAMRFRP